MCACVRACVRACMRACVRVCVRACSRGRGRRVRVTKCFLRFTFYTRRCRFIFVFDSLAANETRSIVIGQYYVLIGPDYDYQTILFV